jgi:Xaa-Pro aminopeptidase
MAKTDIFDYEYPNTSWSRVFRHYDTIVSNVMNTKGLDALILFCRDNIRVASRFRVFDQFEMGGSIAEEYACVIDGNGDAQLFQPWNEPVASELAERLPRIKEWTYIPAWIPEGITTDYWAKRIGEKIEKLRAKKVGFDHISSVLQAKLGQILSDRVRFESVFTDLLEERMTKTTEEIKLLEYAADLTDGATEDALKIMRPGVGEHQIIAEFAKRMYEEGAETISHLSIGSKKLGAPTARQFRRGEPVMIDTGFYCKGGYSSDEARTGFVGKPPKEFMEMYNLLKETMLKTAKDMTPGRKASEIDLELRRPLLEAGYVDSPYATGHGIGLRLMELPQIDKTEFMTKDYQLEENMCIAIEPQVGSKLYRAKLENVIVVESGGGRSINNTTFLE